MASKTFHAPEIDRSDVKFITGKMTGSAGVDLVFVSGCVLTGVRTGAGVFNLTFRDAFPQDLLPFTPGIVGTTVGLTAVFSAWDTKAKTATVKFSIGAAATDPAATDSVRFCFLVRNSGAN